MNVLSYLLEHFMYIIVRINSLWNIYIVESDEGNLLRTIDTSGVVVRNIAIFC